jgi:UDPglucose 6-dehydrogenase
MRIAIVGTGYVGLVTGTCLADSGHEVCCVDIDQEKVAQLRSGQSPIYEPGLSDLLVTNMAGGRLTFTTDAASAYDAAEIIFICVGTPSDEHGNADLSAVLGAARSIGDAIDAGPVTPELAKIVVVKSTVPVGTNGRVEAEIRSRTKRPFFMASNPEFLKEGAAIQDFTKPDRVVVGCEMPEVGERMTELYRPFVRQGHPILIMDIRSAEMVKYASNAMLATKISFVNEVAELCEAMGADVDNVRKGMCSDARIGNQFLYPGIGYGGSCFPKDVLAMIGMARESSTHGKLLRSVDVVNRHQRHRFIERIDKHFRGQLRRRRIAVWGLSFKPGTDDIREAPSLTVIDHLLLHGARVTVYDPVAMPAVRKELGDRVTYAKDQWDAIDDAQALIICTDWNQFKNPMFSAVKDLMAEPVIFDGRNLYDREVLRSHGFTYCSVGRPDVLRKQMIAVEAVA